MTKTDFAELKDKLCRKIYVDIYVQREHDTAIIIELIEIIKLQNKEVESYARYIYCAENCKLSTSWSDHAKCTCGSEKLKNSVKSALSETTTRLQKLKDGLI